MGVVYFIFSLHVVGALAMVYWCPVCVCRVVVGCALPHSLASSSYPTVSLWVVLRPFCRAHIPQLADTVLKCLPLPATVSLIPCGVMPKCCPFP